MSTKVSVIIPVYNSRQWISDCLESLMSQTLEDMEAIIVDDCCLDDSISIARSLVDEYNGPITFKFCQTDRNSGPGVARNKGIAAASGEYILFLDSDDRIPDRFCETMYNTAKVNDADIACCDLTDGSNVYIQPDLIDMKSYLRKYISYFTTFIFRKNFIQKNEITFPPYKNSEDSCFLLCSLVMARKSAQTHEVQYEYRKRPDSLSYLGPLERSRNRLLSLNKCICYVRKHREKLEYRGGLRRVWLRKFIGMALKDFLLFESRTNSGRI